MILISNCPHNNGIYTLRDDEAGLIIKSSYSPDGMRRLDREYAGYKWYFDLVGLTAHSGLSLTTNAKSSYSRLAVTRFLGKAGNPYRNIDVNHALILKAIELYAGIWPRENGDRSPLHGDFSLGNLIVREGDIVIIDWEHFHRNAAPWGFDLVNMLYESAFFSFESGGLASRHDRRLFTETRRIISDLLRPKGGFECSLDHLTRFITANVSFWGSLVNKLPVMKLSSAQREALGMLEQQ